MAAYSIKHAGNYEGHDIAAQYPAPAPTPAPEVQMLQRRIAAAVNYDIAVPAGASQPGTRSREAVEARTPDPECSGCWQSRDLGSSKRCKRRTVNAPRWRDGGSCRQGWPEGLQRSGSEEDTAQRGRNAEGQVYRGRDEGLERYNCTEAVPFYPWPSRGLFPALWLASSPLLKELQCLRETTSAACLGRSHCDVTRPSGPGALRPVPSLTASNHCAAVAVAVACAPAVPPRTLSASMYKALYVCACMCTGVVTYHHGTFAPSTAQPVIVEQSTLSPSTSANIEGRKMTRT